MWKSEIDVQRRWFCALVTYRSDVHHYVDIMILQERLQNNVQNK